MGLDIYFHKTKINNEDYNAGRCYKIDCENYEKAFDKRVARINKKYANLPDEVFQEDVNRLCDGFSKELTYGIHSIADIRNSNTLREFNKHIASFRYSVGPKLIGYFRRYWFVFHFFEQYYNEERDGYRCYFIPREAIEEFIEKCNNAKTDAYAFHREFNEWVNDEEAQAMCINAIKQFKRMLRGLKPGERIMTHMSA